jgi:hypothetical protein
MKRNPKALKALICLRRSYLRMPLKPRRRTIAHHHLRVLAERSPNCTDENDGHPHTLVNLVKVTMSLISNALGDDTMRDPPSNGAAKKTSESNLNDMS